MTSLLVTLLLGGFILLGYALSDVSKNKEKVEFYSVTIAFGTMAALMVVDLLPEIFEYLHGAALLLLPVCIGVGIFLLIQLDKQVPDHDHGHSHGEHCSEKNLVHLGVLSAIAISLHNIIEGMTVYSAGKNDLRMGLTMALAVGLHNIPMGMVIGAALKHSGLRRKTFLLSCASLSTFVGGLMMRILWGSMNDLMVGVLLCLALSMILYILIFELFPHIEHAHKPKASLGGILVGVAIIAVSSLIGG